MGLILITSSSLLFYSWHLLVRARFRSLNVDTGLNLTCLVFSVLTMIGDFASSPSLLNFLDLIPTNTVFFASTAAINVLLTALIVGKLVLHHRSVTKSLGESSIRWHETVISVLIESSALFSICAIASAATFGNNETDNNAGSVIISLTSQMTVSR